MVLARAGPRRPGMAAPFAAFPPRKRRSRDLSRGRHTRCYYRGRCEVGPCWSGWGSRCWPRAAVTICPAREPSPSNPPPDPTTGALCASGQICTLAGTGVPGDGADGLPARETRLYLPQDTTVGPDGRIYVVDWNNHRIRVIDGDGRMRIVAGAGELGIAADDPSTGRLNHPTNVTFDPLGSPDEMWIAAWHNSRVKKVDLATGSIIDMCGTGKRGFAGNGGPAAAATLDLPVAIVFDARRKSFDRRPGEPDDPPRRSDHRRDHDDRRHRPLRRRDQPESVRAQRRRPRDRGRLPLPDRPDGRARRARSRSRPTAPSTSPTPTTSGCAASTPPASSPPTRAPGPGASPATAGRPPPRSSAG